MSVLANSNAIESGGYNIDRSLRFRSSASANLTRTPSSTGNRKTWTWSGWLKRGSIAQTGTIWGSNFSSGGFGLAFGNFSGAGVNPEIMGVTLYAVGTVTTNAVFRDPSAGYHIVAKFDSTQATQANRFVLYVNGVQQALNGTLNVTLNADYNVNLAGAPHVIGGESGYYNDLYMAEVNFIDGQALTPSSFGQTDAVTGVWVPKKYTGTYGTNGFYLDFKDNTSATTLAYDKSGNGNNWTANNISTTAGATYDSMLDVPTLTSATAANFCTLNPLTYGFGYLALNSGNLNLGTNGLANWLGAAATIGVSSGKWYWEVTPNSSVEHLHGIADVNAIINVVGGTNWVGYSANSYGYYNATGNKYNNNVSAAYGSSYTASDVIGVALDLTTGTLTFYKNGVSQGVAYSGLSGTFTPACSLKPSSNADMAYANFGQRPFSYTPPTGFKALNTYNLPDPVIKKPNQYMDATTYTGTGASNAVVNAAGFQPDLVWLKNRNYGAGTNHVLVDSVRGTSVGLASNLTNADFSTTGNFSSINSNGFTVAGTTHDYNFSTDTFVGWQWKKGATPGFDIVTYTGTGANQSINHSLGVAPKMMIMKDRTSGSRTVDQWPVYHASLGATQQLYLNSTQAAGTATVVFNDTAPTSSVFTVGTWGGINYSDDNYVAYLFAEIPGFSKFGSYTGNGSADGPFVYCGFRPKYVLLKSAVGQTGSWGIYDAVRGTYNVDDVRLFPNLSNAEAGADGVGIDILSNGFKIRTANSDLNTNGIGYIYAAFAENPFKYSLAR